MKFFLLIFYFHGKIREIVLIFHFHGKIREIIFIILCILFSRNFFFKNLYPEKATETKFMEIPIVYEVSNLSHGLHKKSGSGEPDKETSPQTAATAGTSGGSQKQHFEFPPRPLLQVASQSSAYTDPMDAFNFDKPTYEYFTPLRLRPGAQKKIPVCIFKDPIIYFIEGRSPSRQKRWFCILQVS